VAKLISDTLLNLGFRDIGSWTVSSEKDGINYRVGAPNPPTDGLILSERNALYAFVHGDRVMYIGKTAQTICKRLTGYQKPHRSQRTNGRCNAKINELLARGADISGMTVKKSKFASAMVGSRSSLASIGQPTKQEVYEWSGATGVSRSGSIIISARVTLCRPKFSIETISCYSQNRPRNNPRPFKVSGVADRGARAWLQLAPTSVSPVPADADADEPD
jgi:hypothetical protein